MQKIDMRWQWSWPRIDAIRSSKFFDFEFFQQDKGDHSPQWNIFLRIGRVTLLDFGRYNIHHCEETERRSALFALNIQRKKGALWGHLVADAVGTSYEFKSPGNIPAFDKIDMIPPEGYKKSWGAHPYGIWSDDGSQMLNLIEYYQDMNKNPEGAEWFYRWSHQLIKWFDGHLWYQNNSFDSGLQTMDAIKSLKWGVHPLTAANGSVHTNGNGSLMRTIPIALLCEHYPDDKFYREVENISHLTHPHRRSKMACVFYCDVARQLFKGESLTSAIDIVDKKMRAYYSGDELDEYNVVWRGKYDEPQGTGYVVNALWSAIHAIQTTTNYRDCIKTCIALGNDTDTTACIAGGLAGIIYGFDGIPSEWMKELKGKEIATDLIDYAVGLATLNDQLKEIEKS